MNASRFNGVIKAKSVIAMLHFPPLPGSPDYDEDAGMEGVVSWVERDLDVLQAAGVDAVMFGNESDRPYQLKADFSTVAAMAYVIGRLAPKIEVPYGVDVLWDPEATVSLGSCVGAKFVREVFTGLYASDMGLWNCEAGKAQRLRRNLSARNMLMFYNINAEFATRMDSRPIELVAKSVEFSSKPDAICISGGMTGSPPDIDTLCRVKEAVASTPIIMNTGVNQANVTEVLGIADAVIVGTALKTNGDTWKPVDPLRVEAFMTAVRAARKGCSC